MPLNDQDQELEERDALCPYCELPLIECSCEENLGSDDDPEPFCFDCEQPLIDCECDELGGSEDDLDNTEDEDED